MTFNLEKKSFWQVFALIYPHLSVLSIVCRPRKWYGENEKCWIWTYMTLVWMHSLPFYARSAHARIMISKVEIQHFSICACHSLVHYAVMAFSPSKEEEEKKRGRKDENIKPNELSWGKKAKMYLGKRMAWACACLKQLSSFPPTNFPLLLFIAHNFITKRWLQPQKRMAPSSIPFFMA